mgnify:CR=1 FL=1
MFTLKKQLNLKYIKMGLLKTSKVKNVQSNGTWEGKFGLMYKFEVEMEDGNVGEYSSKSKEQDKFVVGKEMEYEYDGGKFPKIKPHYNKGNFTGGFKGNDDRQRAINRWAGLGRAIDYLGAAASEEQLYKQAETFIEWVNKTEVNTDNKKDDLPF